MIRFTSVRTGTFCQLYWRGGVAEGGRGGEGGGGSLWCSVLSNQLLIRPDWWAAECRQLALGGFESKCFSSTADCWSWRWHCCSFPHRWAEALQHTQVQTQRQCWSPSAVTEEEEMFLWMGFSGCTVTSSRAFIIYLLFHSLRSKTTCLLVICGLITLLKNLPLLLQEKSHGLVTDEMEMWCFYLLVWWFLPHRVFTV